jgi:hypothetical protein
LALRYSLKQRYHHLHSQKSGHFCRPAFGPNCLGFALSLSRAKVFGVEVKAPFFFATSLAGGSTSRLGYLTHTLFRARMDHLNAQILDETTNKNIVNHAEDMRIIYLFYYTLNDSRGKGIKIWVTSIFCRASGSDRKPHKSPGLSYF